MKKTVEVRFFVDVEVDETKFTEKWMKDFRESFYPLYSIDDHIKHIAQLEAREILTPVFVEGYGPLKTMGIKAEVIDVEIELS
jgi:hypothetical protein